jgi:hypothetical protein
VLTIFVTYPKRFLTPVEIFPAEPTRIRQVVLAIPTWRHWRGLRRLNIALGMSLVQCVSLVCIAGVSDVFSAPSK